MPWKGAAASKPMAMPKLAAVVSKMTADSAARAWLDRSRGQLIVNQALEQLVAASPHAQTVASLATTFEEDPQLEELTAGW